MTEIIILEEEPEQIIAERAILEAGAYDREYAQVQQQRQAAYVQEADPLRDYYLRDEGTKEAWLDKVSEIRERFPYPVKEDN